MTDVRDKTAPGRWWQGLIARLRGRSGGMRRPYVRRHDGFVSLQFVRRQTQSRMVEGDPGRLLVGYTRTMFAALLWQPAPQVLGLVGLGGGSQVKFAYAHMAGIRIEVVENNPHVVALRDEFRVPADDARLSVRLDDGARFVAARAGAFDVLLVDGYDEHGIPAELSTQQFYDDCRDALAEGGVMACNLYVRDPQLHIDRLQRAFGARHVLIVDEPKMSNRVAFAWRGALPALEAEALCDRIPADLRALLSDVLPRIAARLVRHRTLDRAD
ncbi:transferase [Luteimonas deserti]|uniref:Transferase n=1 Tax=Luteimonas deserti TaxID=2752306 RepID=A0A7Z0QUQ9_9GAMM|nr:transferase [Luteimonas deserti]NYZ64155.1 transferase [Luteimonas deserti]